MGPNSLKISEKQTNKNSQISRFFVEEKSLDMGRRFRPEGAHPLSENNLRSTPSPQFQIDLFLSWGKPLLFFNLKKMSKCWNVVQNYIHTSIVWILEHQFLFCFKLHNCDSKHFSEFFPVICAMVKNVSGFFRNEWYTLWRRCRMQNATNITCVLHLEFLSSILLV